MNILITGNTGFVGRHLTEALSGHTLFFANSKVNNLLNPINPDNIPVRLDAIYHLAVWIKAGTFPVIHKADLWEKNQLIHTHAMSYWLRHQPQAKFITLGTSCAYSPGVALVEDNYLVGEPDPDMYGYATTKRMLLHGLRCYREQYGLDYKYIIPGTLNGAGFEDTDTHFNFDFVKKIYAGKFKKEPVIFWGDGTQNRQVVDVSDVVDVLINGRVWNQPVNLSDNYEYPLSMYARIICDIMGYPYQDIIWDTNRWVGVRTKLLVNSKMRDYPFTTMEESFRRSVEYYIRKHS